MLSFATLPLRSAGYHWRGNLPVFLGVAVGAAVLTGALLIGDSLRGSLRARAERQLNGVQSAYLGPRLVRQELAEVLPDAVPALVLTAAVQSDAGSVGRATIYGLDAAGFARFGVPDAGVGVVLADRVAGRLRVAAGDKVRLGVEKLTAVPRSSLLGRRGLDDVTDVLTLPVTAVLPADHPANDLSLAPSPAAPLTVFVGLAGLQARVERPGRVNALLSASPDAKSLSATLAAALNLSDWGLRAEVGPSRKAYVSVESESLVLDPATVAAVTRAAAEMSAPAAPTVAYLANALTGDREPLPNSEVGTGRKVVPYSVIAAVDPAAPPPLGPFLPAGVAKLADDEIILADWQQSPLKGLPAGAPVTAHYFKPELEAGTEEASAPFRLAGYVPLAGPARDPDLTPRFPGVTDKLSIGDWNLPFTLNNRRIQKRDEDYWDEFKATPKAYITLAAGEKLFGSRFGVVTSVRVAPPAGTAVAAFQPAFAAKLLATLDPAAGGLVVQPVRDQVLAASRGGTDFGALFLMFSGLLISAALLLVGLLFRLTVERRAKEVGVLLAAGYSPGQVGRLLLSEGMTVAAAGALVGLPLAAGYAAGMLRFLTSLWPDGEVGGYLTLHPTALSFGLGAGLTLAVAAATVVASLRGLRRVPPPALLRGVTQVADPAGADRRVSTRSLVVAAGCAVAGAASLVLGGQTQNPDYRAGGFFGGGFLLLVAGLTAGRAGLIALGATTGGGLARLGARNAGRNVGRSLLIAALIALAAFLVVSVESFRRRPDAAFATRAGGSGGFTLMAEADVPLARPFDAGPGRDDLAERFERLAQTKPAAERKALLDAADADLSGVTAVPMRLQGGDDASCLNLYQAGKPRVAGVPDALIDRAAFRFGDTLAESHEERANPWLLLKKSRPAGPDGVAPVSVVCEQNTALFMFKTGVGGTVPLADEAGRAVPGVIVGLLQDSVFQSEVLVADADFRRLYPRQDGYRLFLIDAPADKATAVAGRLEQGLQPNGFVVTSTAEKVATYQAVVGAYLSTFQLLGGFALLLAILGLGVVVLRGVWERGSEFALLRAVGYPAHALRTLTLAETGLVLTLGLGVGVGAAVLSVLPNVALGGSVPLAPLAGLLAAVLATGAGVSALAVRQVGRADVIPALRQE